MLINYAPIYNKNFKKNILRFQKEEKGNKFEGT